VGNKRKPLFLGMQKLLAGFLFLVLFGFSEAWAQTSIGIRGGISSSSIRYRYEAGRAEVRAGGITAPTFALVIEHFASKNAGIQIEFQKITLGYTQSNELNQTNISEWDYLKVPFLANFYAGNSGRFHIKLGPHFGYMLQARDVQREFVGDNTNLPTYGGPSDDPNRLMYGITVGAGLSKLFGKSTLEGDFRFSYEFGRPERQDRIFDMNSTNIEITLTYMFQFLKKKNEDK
jgi:hypothetical protein